MASKIYKRGRAKEYRICNKLKDQGYTITQRTAGSHSPIDVIAIKPEEKEILFVQSKPNSWTETQIMNLLRKNIELNGTFKVRFEVR